uniref:Uncharacterized protein n=1 Tax=Oncorhynchus tshawytscha TaxID=74940 RepID=A0AAZ3Q7U0_ONCTS
MSATSIDPQRSKGQASKVQNGSLHQKETVHDNDFEPYLTGQSTQVRDWPQTFEPPAPIQNRSRLEQERQNRSKQQ